MYEGIYYTEVRELRELPVRRGRTAPVNAPFRKRSCMCFDYRCALFLVLTWAMIALTCLVLLGGSKLANLSFSDDGANVTAGEFADTLLIDAFPFLLAGHFNDVLFDQVWRRVAYFALGENVRDFDQYQMADGLLAANFAPWDFLCRAFKFRTSRREWRSATSWLLLKVGTAIAISTTQRCVTWIPDGPVLAVQRNPKWLLLSFGIHAASVFGAVALWRFPLLLFSGRFHDNKFLEQYEPILATISASLATSELVAKTFRTKSKNEHGRFDNVRLPVSSGRQMCRKMKGLSFGLIAMFVPAGVAAAFVQGPHVFTSGHYRFVLTTVLSAQGIFYNLALDFAVWNISLDGLCHTEKGSANGSFRHLGQTSGLALFAKVCQQRRPYRSWFFLTMFWVQATGMRFGLVLYTFAINVVSQPAAGDLTPVLHPQWWVNWMIITAVVTFPPFIVWLLKEVQAPVCPTDGWTWAQIAIDALHQDKFYYGFYGVTNGRAGWSIRPQRFDTWKGQPLP